MPLNLRIFKLVVGLVGLTTASVLLILWLATISDLRERINADLQIARSVAEQAFGNREELLFNAAEVLVADFGFRQAVATALNSGTAAPAAAIPASDVATIRSVLQNHGERINADLMAVMRVSGEVIASNQDKLLQEEGLVQQTLLARTLDQGGAIVNLAHRGRLYQIIMLTVQAPHPIAIAVVGFEIDRELLQTIKTMTGMDIGIKALAPSGSVEVSTLASDPKRVYGLEDLERVSLTSLFNTHEQRVALRFTFSENAPLQSLSTLELSVSQALEAWLAPVRDLMIEILVTAMLLAVLASVMGLVFARNLTRPLAALAQMAGRIAQGDYSAVAPVKINSREIKELSSSLEGMSRDIQEREQKIHYQATHDLLTNLYNRYEVSRVLQEKLDAGERFQVFSFRLQGFRALNNAFGFDSGDGVLVSFAKRLSELGGVAARLNGSEILWLPDAQVNPSQLADIRDRLSEPHVINDVDIKARIVVGHLDLPKHAEDVETLFRHLSIAVEHAQHDAEGLVTYAPGMEEAYLKRLSILRGLEVALEHDQDELHMVYQPKLDLASGKVCKFEALIRWQSKSLGFVPPDVFIPIAEKAGMINQLTIWVVNAVIEDLQRWRQDGVNVGAAINLSVHDVANALLMQHIAEQLAASGLPVSAVEFEITESDLMDDPDQAIQHLQRLKQSGFELSIDDFGTGYSSLAYLKSMPVGALKVDKSFVLKLDADEEDQTIVHTIIDLAHRFGLNVVAEGVENQAALLMLKHWGCRWAQGYFISKPMPADAVMDWLHEFETQTAEEILNDQAG